MAAGNVGTLNVEIRAISEKFDDDIAKVEKRLKKFGRQLGSAGKDLTMGLTVPLAAIGGVSVKAFADFDEAMNQSLALMGKVSDSMRKDMVTAAKEVGRVTTFSAIEAAKGFLALAKEGASAGIALSVLPTIAKFAQAGMMDMTQATNLLKDSQEMLGMSSEDTAKNLENLNRIADVVTAGVNATAQQFTEALTNRAGAALRVLNKDVEEGVAVLEAYADRGIKGAAAGDQFAKVLLTLETNARKNKDAFEGLHIQVYDGTGKMRNMADILADLEKALAGANNQTRANILSQLGFSKKTVESIQNIIGMSDAVRGYEANLRNAKGALDAVVEKQLQSFSSQLKMAKNSLVEISIEIGERLAPLLVKFNQELVSTAKSWDLLTESSKNSIVNLGIFLALLGPVILGIKGIGTVAAFVLTPVGALTLGIIGIGEAIIAGGENFKKGCAMIVSSVADMVAKVFEYLNNGAKAIENFVGSFLTASKKLLGLSAGASFEETWVVSPAIAEKQGTTLDWLAKKYREYAEAIKEKTGIIIGANKDNQESTSNLGDAVAGTYDKAKKEVQDALTGPGGWAPASKEAAKELKKLKEEFIDLENAAEKETLTKLMEKMATAGDEVGYANVKKLLSEKVKEGYIEGTLKGIEGTTPAIKAQAEINAEFKTQADIKAIEGPIVEAQVEAYKKANQESVDFWTNAMENAITGVTFDWADFLKQVAIGFAAQIAAALTGGFGAGMGDLKALGGQIAQSILGGTGGGAGGGLFGSLLGGGAAAGGLSSLFGGATGLPAAPEIIGAEVGGATVATAPGFLASFGPAAASVAVLAAAMHALSTGMDAVKGKAKDLDLAIDTMIFPPVGAGMIAIDWFSKGHKGYDQQVRDELRKKLQEMNILDENFYLKVPFGGLNFGAEQIGGANTFDVNFGKEFAAETTAALDPLGLILQEQLDLTDKLKTDLVGMLVNAALEGENFNEVLINIQSIYEQFGVTAEQTEDAVTKMFLDGKISVEQFGAALQQVNLIAQDNLVGTGSMSDAINMMAKSMDNPRLALKALELAFKEASELGSNQLQILGDYIEATFGPEARAEFDKIKTAGVTTFADFADLSGNQIFALYDIISKFAAGAIKDFGGIKTQIDSNTQATDEFGEALDNLDGKKVDVNIAQHPITLGGGAANGDVIFGRQQRIVGEMGPEAILPLKRIGGKLGVIADGMSSGGNPIIYNIDARGAAPGVENNIRNALLQVKNLAVAESVSVIQNMLNRS